MHTSREVLAGLVFDDRIGSSDDHEHLAGCPQCRAELDQLTHAQRLAHEVTPEDLQKPSDRVWERIRAELSAVLDEPAAAPEAWRQVSVPQGFGSAAELARAHLSARPGWTGAHGTAVVEGDPSRHRTVRIRMTLGGEARDADEGAHLAAWLIAPDLSGMVRLGELPEVADTEAWFDLPAEVDLLRYPVVDLSRQPAEDDGTAAHSGDSIVRGVLA